jgi:hypothetical protein
MPPPRAGLQRGLRRRQEAPAQGVRRQLLPLSGDLYLMGKAALEAHLRWRSLPAPTAPLPLRPRALRSENNEVLSRDRPHGLIEANCSRGMTLYDPGLGLDLVVHLATTLISSVPGCGLSCASASPCRPACKERPVRRRHRSRPPTQQTPLSMKPCRRRSSPSTVSSTSRLYAAVIVPILALPTPDAGTVDPPDQCRPLQCRIIQSVGSEGWRDCPSPG